MVTIVVVGGVVPRGFTYCSLEFGQTADSPYYDVKPTCCISHGETHLHDFTYLSFTCSMGIIRVYSSRHRMFFFVGVSAIGAGGTASGCPRMGDDLVTVDFI
jgi:hypothetical protein